MYCVIEILQFKGAVPCVGILRQRKIRHAVMSSRKIALSTPYSAKSSSNLESQSPRHARIPAPICLQFLRFSPTFTVLTRIPKLLRNVSIESMPTEVCPRWSGIFDCSASTMSSVAESQTTDVWPVARI